jgi:hypothetical protein
MLASKSGTAIATWFRRPSFSAAVVVASVAVATVVPLLGVLAVLDALALEEVA